MELDVPRQRVVARELHQRATIWSNVVQEKEAFLHSRRGRMVFILLSSSCNSRDSYTPSVKKH